MFAEGRTRRWNVRHSVQSDKKTHTEHSLIKIKKIYKKYVYVNDELIAAVVALKHNVRDNKLVIAY